MATTTMPTPRGCLKSISTVLKRLASNGDVEGLRAYVRSDAFLTAFAGLDPDRRRSAMRAYAKAETLCEAKARHPLVKPKAHRRQAGGEGRLERSYHAHQAGRRLRSRWRR